MSSAKFTNCPNCAVEMEVNVFHRVLVTCPGCGRNYRPHFNEERKVWILRPEAAADLWEGKLRIKPGFGSGLQRKQTDLSADCDQVVDKKDHQG